MEIIITREQRALVLAALYNNASAPFIGGMAYQHYRPGETITVEEAQEIINNCDSWEGFEDVPISFDYFRGRPLKIDLPTGEPLDFKFYDLDNGMGTYRGSHIVSCALKHGFVRPAWEWFDKLREHINSVDDVLVQEWRDSKLRVEKRQSEENESLIKELKELKEKYASETKKMQKKLYAAQAVVASFEKALDYKDLVPEFLTPDGECGLRCSFCYKGNTEVDKLIAGPRTYICNRCIGTTVDVLIKHSIPFPYTTNLPEEDLLAHLEARLEDEPSFADKVRPLLEKSCS